jgi:hypothetical protein
VVDSARNAVFRVDPETGNRIIISDADSLFGTGPAFRKPVGIAVEEDGTIVVIDQTQAAVFRVDPETGNRQIIAE